MEMENSMTMTPASARLARKIDLLNRSKVKYEVTQDTNGNVIGVYVPNKMNPELLMELRGNMLFSYTGRQAPVVKQEKAKPASTTAVVKTAAPAKKKKNFVEKLKSIFR